MWSGSRDFDERGPHRGRLRDRLACISKAVEVQGNRLADQPFDLLLRVADYANARDTGAIGAHDSPSCSITTRYSLIDAFEDLPAEGYSPVRVTLGSAHSQGFDAC
jgi:hypothetical protein